MGHLWYNEKRAGLALGAGLPPPPPLLPLLLLLLPMLPLIGAKGTSHIQVRNNLHIRIISYTKYRVCKGRNALEIETRMGGRVLLRLLLLLVQCFYTQSTDKVCSTHSVVVRMSYTCDCSMHIHTYIHVQLTYVSCT